VDVVRSLARGCIARRFINQRGSPAALLTLPLASRLTLPLASWLALPLASRLASRLALGWTPVLALLVAVARAAFFPGLAGLLVLQSQPRCSTASCARRG